MEGRGVSVERQRATFVTERVSRGWSHDGATLVATALHPLDGPAPAQLDKQIRKRAKALARSTPRDEQHAVELARVSLHDYAALARTSEAWDLAERWADAATLVEPTDDSPPLWAGSTGSSDSAGATGPHVESGIESAPPVTVESRPEGADPLIEPPDVDKGERVVPGIWHGPDAYAPVALSRLEQVATALDDLDELYLASTKAHGIAELGTVIELVGADVAGTEVDAIASSCEVEKAVVINACATAFRAGYATAAIALDLDLDLSVAPTHANSTSTDRAAARLFVDRLAPREVRTWFALLGPAAEVIVVNSGRHLASVMCAGPEGTPGGTTLESVQAACTHSARCGFALAVIEQDLAGEPSP